MFDLKDMNIISYEKGNADKIVANPTCAFTFGTQEPKHSVKVIVQGDKAARIHNYITSRRKIGFLENETVSMIAEFKEVRNGLLVLNNPSNISFNLKMRF